LKNEFQQNDVTEMRNLGDDLNPRWKGILTSIVEENGFSPDWQEVRKSQWWKTGKIGAVSINGKFENQDAVLKIQGTKPNTSEADSIKSFEEQNESKVIRAPKVLFSKPWTEIGAYEALIFEKIEGGIIVEDRPVPEKQLNRFFEVYKDYKQNCLNKPWVKRPKSWKYSIQFQNWLRAVENMQKLDKYSEEGDMKLALKGVEIIENNLSINDMEFMHGHVAIGDFIEVSKDEVVIFSNLFWGWRIPFYDAVFAYHWWMLGMHHKGGLTEKFQENERNKWFDKIFNLDVVKQRKGGEKLVNLALLERAVPALMVDRFMIDLEDEHSSRIVINGARKELQRLIKVLQ